LEKNRRKYIVVGIFFKKVPPVERRGGDGDYRNKKEFVELEKDEKREGIKRGKMGK